MIAARFVRRRSRTTVRREKVKKMIRIVLPVAESKDGVRRQRPVPISPDFDTRMQFQPMQLRPHRPRLPVQYRAGSWYGAAGNRWISSKLVRLNVLVTAEQQKVGDGKVVQLCGNRGMQTKGIKVFPKTRPVSLAGVEKKFHANLVPRAKETPVFAIQSRKRNRPGDALGIRSPYGVCMQDQLGVRRGFRFPAPARQGAPGSDLPVVQPAIAARSTLRCRECMAGVRRRLQRWTGAWCCPKPTLA